MKKLLLLTFMFSMVFLASCSKQENIENTTNTNSEKNIQSEIDTKEYSLINDIKKYSVKNILKMLGETEREKVYNNNKILKVENFNVVLYENGEILKKLTNDAIGNETCREKKEGEDTQQINSYKIIVDSGEYGIIKKETIYCGLPYIEKTYFYIYLENEFFVSEDQYSILYDEYKRNLYSSNLIDKGLIDNYYDLKENYNTLKEIHKIPFNIKNEKIIDNFFIIEPTKDTGSSAKYIFLDWLKFTK